ncbi:MAG: 50S ribosomal protein L16 [Candidatus Bathyarchaeia archaeon]
MPKRIGSMSYTRQEYVHSKPPTKVTRFVIGDPSPDYEYAISLVAEHSAEIKGSALESARVTSNKVVSTLAGTPFLIRVLIYPHEIVRAHKFMGFAGADRLSQGMRRSFGRPTDRAAKVSAGQPVLAIYTMEAGVEKAKEALKRASKKLPITGSIVVTPLKEKNPT